MRIEVEVPEGFRLKALNEWNVPPPYKIWRAEIARPTGTLWRIGTGDTPQEAIDAGVAALLKTEAADAAWSASRVPDLGITIDLSSLGVKK